MSDQVSSPAMRMPAAVAPPPRARRGRARRAGEGRQQVDAGERSNASATVSRSRRGEGSAVRSFHAAAGSRRPWRPRPGSPRSPPSALVGLVGPVPLQHGELGMVQRPALAVAEHPGEIEDLRLAGRQQLLAGEFRRGVQVARRRVAAGAISSVAKACRWVSLPGETCSAAVSTSTKPRRRNQSRSADMMRPRASRNGRRSA